MKTLLKNSIKTAFDLGLLNTDQYRTPNYVYQKISEEMFEVSEELEKKLTGKVEGKDGIGGELIDTMISILDFYVLLKLKSSEGQEKILEDLNLLFNLNENKPFGELKPNENQTISLLNVLSQGSHIAVLVQMLENTTYKKPENYNVKDTDELTDVLTAKLFLDCLRNYHLNETMNEDNMSEKDVFHKFSKTWMKKLNKWREKRNLEQL